MHLSLAFDFLRSILRCKQMCVFHSLCLMTDCILHCFMAHFVKTTEMEPKQLAFEDRGYK